MSERNWIAPFRAWSPSDPLMKILLVTAAYLPDGLGGVELSLARFAKWAQAEGHQVMVFRRLADESADEFALLESDVDGVPVVGVNYRFSDATDFLFLVNNPAIQERFETVLAEFSPDVVHVHHLTCLTTGIVDAARAKDIPVAMSLHDFWMGCPRGQRIQSDLSHCPEIEVERCTLCYRETWPHWFPQRRDPALEGRIFGEYHARIREVLDAADALVVPSPFASRIYQRYGVPERRLSVIEYGMDREQFRGASRESSQFFRVGFMGTVLPSKGVHVLIDAFRRVGSSDRLLDIHGPLLPFHNDHTYGERLEEMAHDWKAQITFHGAYAPDQAPGILAGLDALVVPSIWYETYCMVIREGFLAGVPVIASNFGAMADAIEHERTGLLFQMGDAVDLADKIDRLARDRELCARLADSEKRVNSVEKNGQQTVSLYERLRNG